MLGWIKRLANKDFHRRSIPDGLMGHLLRKTDAHGDHGSPGFERKTCGTIEPPQKSRRVPIGCAFGKNPHGRAATEHLSGAFKSRPIPLEPRSEHVEKSRLGRLSDQEDGFPGAQHGGDAGNQGKIPICNEADELPATFEGEKNGKKQRLETRTMIHRHDEWVLVRAEILEPVDVDDIAPQHPVDQPEEEPAQPPRKTRQGPPPDLGDPRSVPSL